MSRDYLAELRAEPAPTRAATPSPHESEKTATQGTAKAAKSPFDSFDSSRGGRFSEIEGAPAVIAEPVRCADCAHWQPSGVQQHGDCGAGAAGTAGLWATDLRACESWLPPGLAVAVHAMADRWHYSADEREWTLEQATQHPAEWLRLIEADLAGRRWPGGEGWQEGGL